MLLSDTLRMRTLSTARQWTRPEKEYLRSGGSFSALCLMFGEQLHDDLSGVPIGA